MATRTLQAGKKPAEMPDGRGAWLLRAGVTAPTLLAAGAILSRPWHMRWGATAAEQRQLLPGDSLVTHADPASISTRAITINASPSQIWPWLVQIGQDRAGFYSYGWLENLLGCDIHNTRRIVPAWQQLAPGDEVRIAPPEVGAPPFVVAQVIHGEALVLGHPSAGGAEWTNSWQFVLRPQFNSATRLLIRSSYADHSPLFRLIEPGVFIMERGMLRGLKRRVEESMSFGSMQR